MTAKTKFGKGTSRQVFLKVGRLGMKSLTDAGLSIPMQPIVFPIEAKVGLQRNKINFLKC